MFEPDLKRGGFKHAILGVVVELKRVKEKNISQRIFVIIFLKGSDVVY